MARVTVEDCLDFVENRFELVLVASKRSRQIANGSQPFVPLENDKPTVLALREIAEQHVGPSILDDEPEAEITAAVEEAQRAALMREGAEGERPEQPEG